MKYRCWTHKPLTFKSLFGDTACDQNSKTLHICFGTPSVVKTLWLRIFFWYNSNDKHAVTVFWDKITSHYSSHQNTRQVCADTVQLSPLHNCVEKESVLEFISHCCFVFLTIGLWHWQNIKNIKGEHYIDNFHQDFHFWVENLFRVASCS